MQTKLKKHNNVRLDPILTWLLQRSVLQSQTVTPDVYRHLSDADADPQEYDTTFGFSTEK